MRTSIVLITLLVTIGLIALSDQSSNAQQNKSDQFEMPVVTTAPGAKPTKQKDQPKLYVLTIPKCAPCARLKGEITGGSAEANWLLNNYKVLFVKVASYPSVMDKSGTQFIWPADSWLPDKSPLKALTKKLGFKEKSEVGIKDLMKANADLVFSEFSGAEDVKCIPPSGTPVTVKGDFLEDDDAPLQVHGNSENTPRTAIVDLPRVIPGVAKFEREWEFLINGETWQFHGFKGRDANTQTVMLSMPGQEHITGSSIKF